jgi:hypothetical protein
MKIFGVTISRDYEEMKRWRREALSEKESVEFLVERGHMGFLRKKYVWRMDGGYYPIYCLYLSKLLYTAMRSFLKGLSHTSKGKEGVYEENKK